MSDLDTIQAAAVAYGENRYAAGAESRQGEVDAAREAQHAAEVHAAGVQAAYDAHMATHQPTDPDPDPEPPIPSQRTILGYSAKRAEWDQEMAKVGAEGITARRIFCDLGGGARDNEALIREAVADGMMPVLSYKVPSITGAISGSLDTVARQAGEFLASLGVPVRFVVWHEPNGDMTPSQFVALNLRLGPLLRSEDVEWGTFINGFLLNRREADFQAFLSDSLVAAVDWVGIDAYHEGDMGNPHPTNTPGLRMRLFLAHLARRRITKPAGIGEYNGFSAAAIADAGDVILDNPQIEFACMWSSQASGSSNDFRLTGARLAAFKATKADPRVVK